MELLKHAAKNTKRMDLNTNSICNVIAVESFRARRQVEDPYRLRKSISSRKIECPFSLTIIESHGN